MRKAPGMPGALSHPPAERRRSLRTAVRRSLIPWFKRSQRSYPWRQRRTTYRIWVSEIMLQQTRADQALPYYRAFLRQFPSVRALAVAPLDAVLKAWEGLGYYARARHLHALARIVVDRHGGRFPASPEEWTELPGIGPYTLAAIGSLAFGWPLAVVDGNVVRVLSRVLAWPRRDPAAYRTIAQELLYAGDPGACNEAWMELGATICAPRNPRCDACPLRAVCAARRAGRTDEFPPAKPRRKVPHVVVGAAAIFNARGEVLIAQRQAKSMLGGLWEFPGGKREPGETMGECIRREIREELGFDIEPVEPLLVVHHAYSHFTIDLHVHRCRRVGGRPRALHCADFAWTPVSRLRDYAFSRADLHVVERLQADTNGAPPASGLRRGVRRATRS